jgi:glycosyltransferase involved in cell wall biosynthesis
VRILQINKFFWRAGGADAYMFDLSALLASHGHDVIHFAMSDPRNRPSPQAHYFTSPLDYRGVGLGGALRKAPRILGGTIYSFEARRKLAELLRDLKPDVAHLHLIDHHLSPSVLHALREACVPAVFTAHDYKLICPNYQLYAQERGEICGRCVPGNYYRCVGRRCMKNSLAASALAAGAMYAHKAMQIYERNVSAFLYATDFVRAKLVEGGMPAEKLAHLPLYIPFDQFHPRAAHGDYIAYAGRLSPEKGLRTLLRAMAKLPEVRLVLLGDGPERPALETLVRTLNLANVEFAGFLEGPAYTNKLAGARMLVLPSEWYETCGLVIWEAHALGLPAIGARIGGVPESIADGESGLLFTPGDSDDLAAKIRQLLDTPDAARAMGARGRARVQAECAAHYDRVMAVYTRAIAGASA